MQKIWYFFRFYWFSFFSFSIFRVTAGTFIILIEKCLLRMSEKLIFSWIFHHFLFRNGQRNWYLPFILNLLLRKMLLWCHSNLLQSFHASHQIKLLLFYLLPHLKNIIFLNFLVEFLHFYFFFGFIGCIVLFGVVAVRAEAFANAILIIKFSNARSQTNWVLPFNLLFIFVKVENRLALKQISLRLRLFIPLNNLRHILLQHIFVTNLCTLLTNLNWVLLTSILRAVLGDRCWRLINVVGHHFEVLRRLDYRHEFLNFDIREPLSWCLCLMEFRWHSCIYTFIINNWYLI